MTHSRPLELIAYNVCYSLASGLDRRLEHDAAVGLGPLTTGPFRMLGRMDVPFGMRHQAEDPAGGIDQTGDIRLAAIGVDRVGPGRPSASQ